jgi:hypothetical protein
MKGNSPVHHTHTPDEFNAPDLVTREVLARAANWTGIGRLPQNLVKPPPAPVQAPRPFQCFRFATLDADVLRSVESGVWPEQGVLRLAAPWTEPRDISHEGKPFMRLEPCDFDPNANDATGALYGAILADAGTAIELGETSDRWLAEGESWAQGALSVAPTDVFECFSHRRETFVMQVADRLAHSYLLPAAEVERITGVKTVSTWTLWPAGHDANRLAAAATAREEVRRQADEQAERERIEAARPVTADQLGAELVAMRRDRLAVDPQSGAPAPPWSNAVPLWSTDSELIYAFRALVGLPLPADYAGDGLRVLAPTTIVPRSCRPIPAATVAVWRFACALAQRGTGDLGPVAADKWSDAGMARARELAAQWAHAALVPSHETGWRLKWLAECIVRGCLVRPDRAEAVIREAADPRNSHIMEHVALIALGAASGGVVSPGCLIPNFTSSPKRSTKKESRA